MLNRIDCHDNELSILSRSFDQISNRLLAYTCLRCPKVFRDGQRVTEHVLAAHVPIEAQFGCGLCANSFEFAHEAMACLHGHAECS